jgi:hypothetical protein
MILFWNFKGSNFEAIGVGFFLLNPSFQRQIFQKRVIFWKNEGKLYFRTGRDGQVQKVLNKIPLLGRKTDWAKLDLKANLARASPAWVNLRDLELDEAWIPALSSNRLPDNFNITFRRYLLRRLSLLAHMVEIGLNSWVRSELINPLEAKFDHLRPRHEVLVTKTACAFNSWSCN